jgi:hypothetical protein
MATLIVIAIVLAGAGLVLGAYVKICSAIRREDRIKGSLRFDAPSRATRNARDLTGISSSRWD